MSIFSRAVNKILFTLSAALESGMKAVYSLALAYFCLFVSLQRLTERLKIFLSQLDSIAQER